MVRGKGVWEWGRARAGYFRAWRPRGNSRRAHIHGYAIFSISPARAKPGRRSLLFVNKIQIKKINLPRIWATH